MSHGFDRLRIVSDGTSLGSYVKDMETGRKISLVQRIEWELDVKDHLAKATITLLKTPVEMSMLRDRAAFVYQRPLYDHNHWRLVVRRALLALDRAVVGKRSRLWGISHGWRVTTDDMGYWRAAV